LASLSEELRKKRFELNRLVDPNWAGGKYGAPGIGGEEVLAALLPAGIGMGGRAIGAGVRGFNAAGKRLDPLAEGISGFVTSPSGQQFLGNWGKSALLGKLSKEIESRFGVASQPWLRRELKEGDKRREETDAKLKGLDEEKEKILRDLKESMPYHREKSQKVVNIGMGATIKTVNRQQIEERKRKEWALTILDQFKAQGASKDQIDSFIENSGVAFNPDRESRFLHPAVLGATEVEQYYPNPEKAEVISFPSQMSSRVLKREADLDETVDVLVEKDSQDLFRKDPKKWLWNLSSDDVLGDEGIDPAILVKALEAQGIDPHAFKRFHYLGVDDPDNPIVPDDIYADYESGTFERDPGDPLEWSGIDLHKLGKDLKESETPDLPNRFHIEGMRGKWVKQLNDLIEKKESGKFPESATPLLDGVIEKARNAIAKADRVFDYDSTQDKSNLTDTEFQMLQDIRNKPEGQRLPFERKELLRLESRTRWGKEFELWENWEYDE
jgi:hypothetical protein